MKKVININFQGRILPIEEASYETLKQYIESLRQYFDAEEGRDEIINDIECRIAELCDDRLKKGAVCITEDDMRLIIESIGRPADFEAQDGFEATTSANASNASNAKQDQFSDNNENPKRLYRDEQNKVIGGVCAGIANYLKLDPLLVRVLWILLFGISFFAYVLLWIAVPNTSTKQIGGAKKRLFRDIDTKVIGGVCAGLSKYFGVRVIYIRLLFLVPTILLVFNWNHFHLFQFWEFDDFPNFIELTFSPSAVFIYIVLWLVLPEAKTTADKLEMRGEKVDINSIKNTIQTDMEGFGKRAQTWGSNMYNKNKINESQSTTTASSVAPEPPQPKGCLHFAGRTLTILFKAFVYFVLGIITISILAALFGFGIVATGLLPLRRFILEDGAHNWYAYAIIVFFIWVPVVGIVTAIIRKIAGIKKANVWVRGGFWSLWALSWIFIPLFFAKLTKSFSKQNDPQEQAYTLPNAKLNYLEVSAQPKLKYYNHTWLKIEPFTYLDQDTVYVRNLRIRIVKAAADSFEVKYVRISNGKTLQEAERLASLINFDLQQKDSTLFLDKGIAINKTDKFRNQHVIMTLAVPVGKRFKITNKGWAQVNVRVNKKGWRSETNSGFIINDGFDGDDWERNVDTEAFDYDHDVEYIMTPTGLERVDGVKTSNNDNEDPEQLKSRLEELKREKEKIENDLKKTWEQKQKEADEIKKQLDKTKDTLKRNSIKAVSKVSDTVKTIAAGFDAIRLLVSRFQS